MKKTITVPHNSRQETLVNVAQEMVDSHEKKTRFPLNQSGQFGIMNIESRGFMNLHKRSYVIACGEDISCTHVEVPLAENKTGIISPCKGVTA
ncbi:MAG: hypothetical protein WC626_06775 [Methanoregula sp.]